LFVLLLLGPLPGPRFHGDRAVLLPCIQGSDHRPYTGDDIVVSVQADGSVFIGPKWYPTDALLAGISGSLARNTQAQILIRIDKTLPFGSVRAVLHVLQQARVSSAFLVTHEAYADEPSFPLPVLFNDAI